MSRPPNLCYTLSMPIFLLLGPDDQGRRADRILRKALPTLPLSLIHRLFRAGKVRLERENLKSNKKLGPSSRLDTGDKILVYLDHPPKINKKAELSQPVNKKIENSSFEIIFQNKDFLVINKASGCLVHSAKGKGKSLELAVRHYLAPQLSASLSFSPGPLHRLDRATSGLIVFSASLKGAQFFSRALQERKIEKTYLAILEGYIDGEKEIIAPLLHEKKTQKTQILPEGRPAKSYIRPLAQKAGISLVNIEIIEGRTHQIRAHAASIGHPLLGDSRYGAREKLKNTDLPFFLHAYTLRHKLGEELSLPSELLAPLNSEQNKLLATFFGANLPI